VGDASKSVQLLKTWRRVEMNGDDDMILGAALAGGDEVVWARS